MTLETLAEHVGLSVRQLQRLEAGEVDPRFRALTALSDALGVSLGALIDPLAAPESPQRLPTGRSLGRQLRALREARGLTLAELSARSGLTAQYLQRVENEAQSPTARVILRIAVALDIRVSVLFGEAD